MSTLEEVDRRLVPERIASYSEDQFRDKILYDGCGSCQDYWAAVGEMRVDGSCVEFHADFLWRRRKVVNTDGWIKHMLRNFRNEVVPGSIRLEAAWHKDVAWGELFTEWCNLVQCQIGTVHVLTDPENFKRDPLNVVEATEEQLNYSDAWDSFRIGSFGASLKPKIPNIGWGMFYGDEFAKEVNADQIAAAGFPIRKIGDGYLVQVTENIQDVIDNFAHFSRRRAELKSLFRSDCFSIKDESDVSQFTSTI